jgi:hypothetical protein
VHACCCLSVSTPLPLSSRCTTTQPLKLSILRCSCLGTIPLPTSNSPSGAATKPGSSDTTAAAAAEGTSTTTPQQQQHLNHSSPDSVLTRSLSAQLSDMGLGPAPGTTSTATPPSSTSAFAAEASTAVPQSGDAAAAAAAPAGGSPSRPPIHPMRSGSGLQPFQSPLRQGSLQRSGSMGMASPVGAVGLRLGRAGSLNSKKSSPNRVCCNALLAAYARAVPPR